MVESRRFIIAIVLSVVVFLVFARFTNQGTPATAHAKTDSAAVMRGAAATTGASTSAATGSTSAATASPQPASQTTPQATLQGTQAQPSVATPAVPAETTTVAVRQDSGATFRMTNVGAAPASVIMNAYDNRVHPGKVDVASGGAPVLRYALVVNHSAPVDLSTT